MSSVCANLVKLFLWNILPCQGWMLVQNEGGNYICIGVQDQRDPTPANSYMDFVMHPSSLLSDSIKNDFIEVNNSKDAIEKSDKSTAILAGKDARTQLSIETSDATVRNTIINLNQELNKLTPLISKEAMMLSGQVHPCQLQTRHSMPENHSTNIHDISTMIPSDFEKSLCIMTLIVLFILFASIFGLQFLEQLLLIHYRINAKAETLELDSFESMNTRMDYLRAIFDTMAVGVVSTDTTMRITFMNSAAGQMCGCCPEAVTGRHIDEIVRLTNGSDNLHIEILLRDSHRKHAMLEDCKLVVESGGSVDVQQWVSPLTVRGELRGSVMLLHDVGAARDLIRRLSYTASHDALTGLPNRAHFQQYLQNSVTSSIKRTAQHVLVYLDLDGFKAVNDTCGHAAGDALLKQVSHLMRLQLRKSDFLARLGGDEFALILFNCEIEHALLLVKHLLLQISEHYFCWEGTISRIGASAGVTRIYAGNTSTKELLAQADSACYIAKQRGKGQVCLFQNCRT